MEAETAELSAQESTFAFRVKGIVLVLLGGLAIRLALATLPGFGVDISLFETWANRLALEGPWNFYNENFFTDYAPGYMYVLLFIGKFNQWFHFSPGQFEYILKLPSIAADLGSAYLLYRFLKDKSVEAALGTAALYLLFPPALLIGSIWGQVDSLLAFFLLLSVYYVAQDRPVAAAVAYTVGFLVKPQAIAALPFLAFWIIRERWPNWSDGASRREAITLWLKCTGVALALLVVLVIPFFTYKPWDIVSQLYNSTNVENYRVNSFWAFNFWNMWPISGGLIDFGFKPDSAHYLGISHRVWGLLLLAASIVSIIVVLRKNRSTGALALGTALSMFAFFLFLTRMHERYVFAFFLPFLAACVLIESRALWTLFGALGAVHFFNLYHVWMYYFSFNHPNESDPLRVGTFYSWLADATFLGTGLETVQVLSIAMFLGFLALLGASYYLSTRRAYSPAI